MCNVHISESYKSFQKLADTPDEIADRGACATNNFTHSSFWTGWNDWSGQDIQNFVKKYNKNKKRNRTVWGEHALRKLVVNDTRFLCYDNLCMIEAMWVNEANKYIQGRQQKVCEYFDVLYDSVRKRVNLASVTLDRLPSTSSPPTPFLHTYTQTMKKSTYCGDSKSTGKCSVRRRERSREETERRAVGTDRRICGMVYRKRETWLEIFRSSWKLFLKMEKKIKKKTKSAVTSL